MGTGLSIPSPMGRVARLESSASSVVVKTLVIFSAGMSLVKAFFDREANPISEKAVEENISKSWRLGGKSLSLATV